jgi:MinD superfamily P-loop ATPase
MKIAVLSGKGGTGKTLVSVNLAAAAGDSVYVDCDVEEPNGRLFFKPENLKTWSVSVPVPQVDPDKCTGCRVCVEFCKYNALAWVGDRLKIFSDLCHSCGGCSILCPEGALTEEEREIGRIEGGSSRGVKVLTGVLNPGEASGIPIIQELFKELKENQPVFIDCPPGSACIVMETVSVADYCVLVAEPTVFGVHNLGMVWELTRVLGKPSGVVLNKTLAEDNPAEAFCREKGIPIIGRISFEQELGLLNSEARVAAWEADKYRELFSHLLRRVTKEAKG